MSELHRVLKPGGWAILQDPISATVTFEDATATTPEDRERLFGQDDHVRRYGPDYEDRLGEAGFAVAVDGFARELRPETLYRFGLLGDEDIYLCRKGWGEGRPDQAVAVRPTSPLRALE